MKKIILIAFIISVFRGAMAQSPAQERKNEEWIDAARIGMITNKLNLSSEQATNFWPVYNEYSAKKKDLRKTLGDHLSESRSLANTDDKIAAEIKEILALKQKEVDIEREYVNKFLKIINPKQVVALFRSEMAFKKMLLNRMNREDAGPRAGQRPHGAGPRVR